MRNYSLQSALANFNRLVAILSGPGWALRLLAASQQPSELRWRKYRPSPWLVVISVAGLLAHVVLGQSSETLSFSVAAYDRLLASVPASQHDVLMGDMRVQVSEVQVWREALLRKLNRGISLQGAFDFVSNKGTPWPDSSVYYDYVTTGTNAMPAAKIVTFEAAIRLWQQAAGIDFIRGRPLSGYIRVRYSGNAPDAPMDSWIGRLGTAQELNVAGWGNVIDCAHELGHALGMTHEQSRPDRDRYVNIFPANMTVDPATDVNYAVVPQTIMRTDYDYDSLMHYPRSANAKTNSSGQNLITLMAKAPNQRWSDGLGPEEIGQKDHLSAGDKVAMSAQYGFPLRMSGLIRDAGGGAMQGVSVRLSGGTKYRGTNPVLTDASGQYEFTGLPRNSGTYTFTPIQAGASFTVTSRTVVAGSSGLTGLDFTQTDSAPPTLTIVQPSVGQIITAPSVASGSAGDNAGLKQVRVALARDEDGYWWNWPSNTWGTTVFNFSYNSKIATGLADWSTALPNLPDGGYQVHAQSVDASDNASSWRFRHFSIDRNPPTVAVTAPGNGTAVVALTNIRGVADDGNGSGIASNRVFFTLYQDGAFWTGLYWKTGTTAQDSEVLLSTDVVGGEWSYNTVPQGADARIGIYAVSVFARDNAGHISTPISGVNSTLFSVDRDPPHVTITTPVDNSIITNLTAVTGTAAGTQGLQEVRYYILRLSDNQFWDGTSWGGGGPADRTTDYDATTGKWSNNSALPGVGTNPFNSLTEGLYDFIAIAYNKAGLPNRTDAIAIIVNPVTYVWNGSWSDDWNNSRNWTPEGTPDYNDRVFISNAAIVNVGKNAVVGEMNLSGDATLKGGSITITNNSLYKGVFNWNSGTIACTLNVASGSTLNLNNTAAVRLGPTGILNNQGTVLWTGTGDIIGDSGSVIINDGLFDVRNNAAWSYASGNTPYALFQNNGTFRKSAADGRTLLGAYNVFYNTGTVDVQSGTVNSSQEFTVESGSTVSGAGVLRIEAGTANLNGTINLVQGGSFELLGGVVTGISDFAGTGSFRWSGGRLAGTNDIGATAKMFITNGAVSLAASAVLNNAGTVIWAGPASTINADAGSRLNNTGLFESRSDSAFQYTSGNTPYPLFNNFGTFRKTGGIGGALGTAFTYYTSFNNTGLVEAQINKITFAYGNSSNATFKTTSISTIEFQSGTHVLDGMITFAGGGTNLISGSTIMMSGTSFVLGAATRLELASGGINGSGIVSGLGTFAWSGGTLGAILDVAASVQVNIRGTADKHLSGKLTMSGTSLWTGSGNISADAGSVLVNNGPLELQSDSAFQYTSGNTPYPLFQNNGTLRKTGGGTGATGSAFAYYTSFNNTGLVEVQTNRISFANGASSNATFNAWPGATIEFLSGIHSMAGTITFGGGGTNLISGATVMLTGTSCVLSNGTLVELASGRLDGTSSLKGAGIFGWSGGTLGANLDAGASTLIRIHGTADKHLSGRLTTGGTAIWTDAGNITGDAGGAIINNGLFEIKNDAGFVYTSGNTPYPFFRNNGTLRKSAASGRTLIGAYNSLQNSGSVDVQNGMIITLQQLILEPGSTVSGTGLLRVEGGIATMNGTTTLAQGGTFELLAGTLTGISDFAGSGAFRWSGGTLTGTNTIGAAVTMFITNGAVALSGSAVLNNIGTTIWDGPSVINAEAGSRLNNYGLFEARNNSTFQYTSGNTPYPLLNNTGTFRKIGGTGSTVFTAYSTLNNAGTLDLENGSLAIAGAYTSTASSAVRIGLGGYTPATQFGQLAFSVSAALNGTLEATFRNNLVLTNGSFFEVATYPAHTREFTASLLPSLEPGLSWRLAYSATSLRLNVIKASAVSGLAKLANGPFQMTLTGPPATAAILTVSTNLINWIPVLTNQPFNGFLFFQDDSASRFDIRFYHFTLVP